MDFPIEEILAEAKVWILSDGKAGHVNQSIGVAEAMGLHHYQIIQLEKAPFGGLLKYIHPALAVKWAPQENFPDIAIGTGSLTAPVLKYIKTHSPKTFTLQMMKPYGKLKLLDAVAVPAHDNVQPAENVLTTVGAPNRIDAEKLATAADEWQGDFAHLPQENITLLVGAPVKKAPYSPAQLLAECTRVVHMAKEAGWGVLCSVSRRTPPQVAEQVHTLLEQARVPYYFYNPQNDKDGRNPYFAMLARAQAVFVTAESVSMVSEAATAGKPTFLLVEAAVKGKFKELLNRLAYLGYVFPVHELNNSQHLQHKVSHFNQNPLNDTARVAGFALARFMRHWQFFYGADDDTADA